MMSCSKRCHNGGKVCYNTYKKAIKSAARSEAIALKTYGVGRKPLYPYVCPYCGFYHLTKNEQYH